MVASIAGCNPVQATDYHVSPRGNDSNPGTVDQPWQTIAGVNEADLDPGDRVLFEAGQTFQGTIALDTEDSGSEGEKVEIGSYGEGRATIDGGDGSGLVATGCNHLVVRNLNFVGSGRKGGNTKDGVFLSEGEDLLVDEVDVSGFQKSGLAVASVRNARITRVYAHDNGATGIGCGGDPAAPTSENVYIGYCVAENNPGDPTNLDNHSGNGIVVGCVKGCVIEYCEAMNNGWDMPRKGNGPVGIWAWNADEVTIQFCIAHHNKSPGWDGGGFDFDGGVTNSVMQYNLSYENVGPGYFLCQYPTAPVWKNNVVRYNISVNDGMRFRNNIFVSTQELIKGDSSRARFEGNCYWSIGEVPFSSEGHGSIEEWAEATGQEMSRGELLGLALDPLLTGVGDELSIKPEDLAELAAYRLSPDSPCVGAGIPIPDNGGRDFWGNALPEKEGLSVGACQKP